MADMKISAAAAQDMLDALVDSLDGTGTAQCAVKIYAAGGVPASVAATLGTDAVTLATIKFSNPAFGAASGNSVVALATATSEDSALANGTAAFWRAYTDAAATSQAGVIQGTCGATGSGADMIMNTTAIAAGATVKITSWTITMPLG